MFASMSRSWEFAKMSYAMIWCHKRLLFFPLISTFTALLVTLSFVLPLWMTGQLEAWAAAMGGEGEAQDWVMYLLTFLFYFCNYFVVIFFNTGLLACVTRIGQGEKPRVSDGLSFAMKRFPQIFAWAFVSAIVGVLLRALEQNKKAGRFVSAILGSAWTALTFFVVPVITMEGVGPIQAFKRSTGILREQWGTALVGNFSLGIISFLLMIPVLLLSGFLIFMGVSSGSIAVTAGLIGLGVMMVLIAAATSSAADMIFKSFLYTYATGQTLPNEVDSQHFSLAFRPAD